MKMKKFVWKINIENFVERWLIWYTVGVGIGAYARRLVKAILKPSYSEPATLGD
jgi:hypothetical protein